MRSTRTTPTPEVRDRRGAHQPLPRRLFVDGVRSPYSLYDYNLATYDEGDSFDHTAARGFIELHGLQSKTWSKVQGPGSGLQPVH